MPRSPRVRSALVWTATALAVVAWVFVLLPGATGSTGRGTPAAIVFDATVRGLAAGLTAVGLVVVYRSVRVINFAQTVMGTVGALLVFKYTILAGVPFLAALPFGLAMGALVGVLFDLALGRRFASSPRLVLTVFTIAFAFLLSGEEVRQGSTTKISYVNILLQSFPGLPRVNTISIEQLTLGIDPRPYLPLPGLDFQVGSLPLSFGFPHLFAIELVLLTLAALMAFYRYTRLGTALRALADNPERAALLGISTGALTSVVWAISAGLSTAGAIATGVVGRPSDIGSFAPSVLFVALAAAIIAKMRSIPVAMVVSVLITVVTNATQWSYQNSQGWVDLALLLLVVGALAVQRKEKGRSESGAAVSWQATEEPRPVPRELASLAPVRALRYGGFGVIGLLLVAYPFFANIRTVNLTGLAFLVGIVGLSLVVLTGWAGQVSLGQFGFLAIGAILASVLAGRVGVPGGFWVVVPLTTTAVAALAALLGLPALRLPGLFLAVVTLGFGIMVPSLLLNQANARKILPDGIDRPQLFFIDFDNERNMYFLCLGALALAGLTVRRLRATRVGRLLIATRDNEANLQSSGVPLLRTKLLAFTIAGGLSGFAGAVFAYQQRSITQESFLPTQSLNAFLFAVVGGIGSPMGAVLGELYNRFTLQILGGNLLLQSLQNVLLVGILLIAPGGFAAMLNGARDSFLRIVAQRRRIVVPSLFADVDPEALRNRLIPLGEPTVGEGLAAVPPDRYALQSVIHQARPTAPAEAALDLEPTR